MNVTVLEYFSIPKGDQAHWASQIARADWRAAVYLHGLLEQGRVQERYGADAKLLLLTQKDDLLAFCTLTVRDELPDEALFPWVGFVYTFPQHRGHRYSQVLIDHACALTRKQGHSRIFLTSNETGLYEKYGFRFLENRETIGNKRTQLFIREL